MNGVTEYRNDGKKIDILAAADISEGDVIVVNGKVFLADADIANGDWGVANAEGVHEVPKATGAWTTGQDIYWDATAEKFTTTSTDNTKAGYAAKNAASADTTGYLKLNQ